MGWDSGQAETLAGDDRYLWWYLAASQRGKLSNGASFSGVVWFPLSHQAPVQPAKSKKPASLLAFRPLERLSYSIKYGSSGTGDGGRGGLNLTIIKSVPVPFPSTDEQTAIATRSDMDAELAALEARLAKTRAPKQGMMQELLTGKTRLV